jgi:3-phenylpropionate/cinnamic acid dioxygenase small subunit
MVDDVDAAVRDLLDRQAIRDCLYRFVRATDRWDPELYASCFHADAVCDYGALFRGNAHDLAKKLVEIEAGFGAAHQHHLTNQAVDLVGDSAHVETYLLTFNIREDGTAIDVSGGRYVDRLERRDGKWRIASRLFVWDWGGAIPGDESMAAMREMFEIGVRDRSDRSYERPLRVEAR